MWERFNVFRMAITGCFNASTQLQLAIFLIGISNLYNFFSVIEINEVIEINNFQTGNL